MTPTRLSRARAQTHPAFQDQLHEDLDDAIEQTLHIFDRIAAQAISQKRALTNEETQNFLVAVRTMPGAVITGADALGIPDPAAEWFDPDNMTEGIQNHAQYHLGRPGECGSNCPAYSPLRINNPQHDNARVITGLSCLKCNSVTAVITCSAIPQEPPGTIFCAVCGEKHAAAATWGYGPTWQGSTDPAEWVGMAAELLSEGLTPFPPVDGPAPTLK